MFQLLHHFGSSKYRFLPSNERCPDVSFSWFISYVVKYFSSNVHVSASHTVLNAKIISEISIAETSILHPPSYTNTKLKQAPTNEHAHAHTENVISLTSQSSKQEHHPFIGFDVCTTYESSASAECPQTKYVRWPACLYELSSAQCTL